MNGRMVGSKPLYVALAQRKEERRVSLQGHGIRAAKEIGSRATSEVEDFFDSAQKIVRKWSNDFVVGRLLNLLVILNPGLNGAQQTCLKSILFTVVNQLLWERSLDLRVMRGIIALACPNQDTGLLFGYLVEVIVGLVCSKGRVDHIKACPKQTLLDVESPMGNPVQRCDEDVIIAELLLHHFCVEEVYVAAMPITVRQAVFHVLNGGTDSNCQIQPGLLLSSQQSPPICCITLEPLLRHDGTLANDVVSIVQSSKTFGKEHAFLYCGRALYDWLGHSQVPRNPETRWVVRPTDIYRLSQ